tara:strand:- start:1041 stop:1256 length:216 start_codon:yes stop_codon:yes gene_type:complete
MTENAAEAASTDRTFFVNKDKRVFIMVSRICPVSHFYYYVQIHCEKCAQGDVIFYTFNTDNKTSALHFYRA